MTLKLFKPEFAELVRSGAKTTTIRPTPKRMPEVGDKLSLRRWTGLPYRSKQEVLREAIIDDVEAIVIGEDFRDDGLARVDGFKNAAEMVAWFRHVHGLPFTGILIRWKP